VVDDGVVVSLGDACCEEAKQLAPGSARVAAVPAPPQLAPPRVVHRALEDGHVSRLEAGERDVPAAEPDQRRRHDHVERVQAAHRHLDGRHEALGVAAKHRAGDQLRRLRDVSELCEH